MEKNNYLNIFKDIVKNDIIVETCYAIDTLDLLKLCQKKEVSHINSCIDVWDYRKINDTTEYSLYYIHNVSRKIITSSIHCPDNNLNIGIKTKPVTNRADATVYS